MKAISIVSPHGNNIALGKKTIEVRSWEPTIPLHTDLLIVENKRRLENDDIDQNGMAVAIVKIKNVRQFIPDDVPEACASDWVPNYYSWELYDLRQIEIPFQAVAKTKIYDLETPHELWDIFDNQFTKSNKVILRGDHLPSGANHLVVHVWPVSPSGELLIQKRSMSVKFYPGIWATTGGSAIMGDNAITACQRELKEELEIDLPIQEFRELFSFKRPDNFTFVFGVTIERSIPFVPNNEVSEIKWVSKDQLKAMILEQQFLNYGEEYFAQLYSKL